MEEQIVNKSTRNFKMIENPDLFIAGLTSSGKSTLSEYISDYYDYRQLRNAGTIKQIICERHGWSPEELEIQKRANTEIRDEHHKESDYLGKKSTLNRCQMIAERSAFEFEFCPDPEKQLVIIDVRDHEEADIYLANDFFGIFLSRTTAEYNAGHWTDNNMFMNGKIVELSNTDDYGSKMIVVINGGTIPENFYNELNQNVIVLQLGENPNAEQLIEAVDDVLSDLIEKVGN